MNARFLPCLTRAHINIHTHVHLRLLFPARRPNPGRPQLDRVLRLAQFPADFALWVNDETSFAAAGEAASFCFRATSPLSTTVAPQFRAVMAYTDFPSLPGPQCYRCRDRGGWEREFKKGEGARGGRVLCLDCVMCDWVFAPLFRVCVHGIWAKNEGALWNFDALTPFVTPGLGAALVNDLDLTLETSEPSWDRYYGGGGDSVRDCVVFPHCATGAAPLQKRSNSANTTPCCCRFPPPLASLPTPRRGAQTESTTSRLSTWY